MAADGNLNADRPASGVCPDEAALRRFDGLALAPLELEQLGDHVASCSRCGVLLTHDEEERTRILASLLTPGDQLTRELEYVEAERALLSSPQAIDGGDLAAAESTSFSEAWSDHSQAPERIGPYQVLCEIGRGGMGIVYRARHSNLKRDAAVKVLPPELTARPAAVKRFYREMESIGQLHDEHIVHAYDAGEWEGIHFLAMELVDGVDVSRLCEAVGPLSTADACEIVCQAAQGLETARRHHMVHRDIKPSNLIVTRSGKVKILDLGLASMRARGGHLLGQEFPVGTVDYMAPEQWRGDPAIDIHADLYSLGCTLYVLLTGQPPFATSPDDGVSKMQAHLSLPPPKLKLRRPDAPEELDSLVERLLSKNPANRPHRPAEVIAELDPFRRGSNLSSLVERAAPRSPDTDDGGGLTRTLTTAIPAGRSRRWSRARIGWSFAALAVFIAAAMLAPRLMNQGGVPRQHSAEELAATPLVGAEADLETEVHALRTLEGHTDVVSAAAISSDGGEILTASHDRTIRLWDAQTGQERRQFFGHEDEVWDVTFRPGAEQAASASQDGTVRLWDLQTGDELRRYDGHTDAVTSVAFSRDGQRMLTASYDYSIQLWNVDSGELIRTLTGHRKWVRDVEFLPDERYAISCDNATVGILWDIESGRMEHVYIGHNTVMSSIRPSSDGKYATSGSWDEMVRIWDVHRGRGLNVLHRNMQPVRQVAFVGDSYYVLSASEDRKARLWNPFSGQVVAWFPGHQEMVLDVECHAASGMVVTASADRTAKVWPLPRVEEEASPAQLPVYDPAGEAAGRMIPIEEPFHTWQAAPTMLRSIAARHDGATVATGGDDAVVRVWAVPQGELLQELTGPTDGVLSVVFSHDDSRLAASSKDGNIYLWDLSTGGTPKTLSRHVGWVTSIAFREDDAQLISTGFDGTVCCWDVTEGRLEEQIAVDRNWINDVSYWPTRDGKLAITSGHEVNPRLVDLEKSILAGQLGNSTKGHVLAVGEISPDGRIMAAAGWRRSVQLTNLIEGEVYELSGHAATIYDLHWEPGSQHLITASADGTLRLWDLMARQEARRFIGTGGGIRGLAILPEHSIVAAADDEGQVLLFRKPEADASLQVRAE